VKQKLENFEVRLENCRVEGFNIKIIVKEHAIKCSTGVWGKRFQRDRGVIDLVKLGYHTRIKKTIKKSPKRTERFYGNETSAKTITI
jgi:hypothetical protein